ADDHAVGSLVATRLIALARRAPGRHRMVPAAAAVGASTHRVVDRIHRDAAHRRADAAPAVGAGLADRAQAVLFVADGADRRAAVDVHLADLARVHAQLRVRAFARQELHRRARGARDLRALAGQHLDAMNRRADRDIAQRQTVAGLDRRFGAAHQLRPGRDAAGRHDVAALA